jgi:carboxyl-terminal processing protease
MRRGITTSVLVVLFSAAAGGWLLQQGVDRAENVYVRVRVLQEVVDRVQSSFVDEVDQGRLYDAAIDGLLRDLGDPHSSFMPRAQYEDLRIRTEGEYGGVGLEVVDSDGFVTVVSPIPGGPGGRVGIRAGDQFYEIDGVRADTMITDQAVELLRGRPGTPVTVRMMRPGVERPIEFTVEREVIVLRAVPFALMLEDGIGYVPLQTVRETSTREVQAAVDSLRREGMEALVFDLRGNTGGLLDEGISVTDLFLDGGKTIVETRGRAEDQNDVFRASTSDRYPGMPIVTLIDGASASAAEIIAGALQDHDRAVLVGETTFGKGSVQSLFRLTGGDVLRLTTARWYTPVGRSIHLDREAQSRPPSHTLSISGQLVQPVDVEGRPEYTSAGGRMLYGGGGITPDLFVSPETLSPSEVAAARGLFQRGGALMRALFDFAVQYLGEHELQPGFDLPDAVLDDLYETLPDFDAEVDREDFDAARRFVRYQLERELAEQALGDVGQFEQLRTHDRQLARALELLREARSPEALLSAVQDAEPDPAPQE